MEKNRFTQNLSNKGQVSDRKSQDASTKWSKRREQQPNSNGQKPEAYRNKPSGPSKSRNFNDKRPKPRNNGYPGIATGGHQYDESEGAGLVEAADQFGTAELHSVFSPGSKKQSNLNHLLNFHYAPRERDQPGLYTKTGNNRSYVKKVKYNKEQYLQANCQFVVKANHDYSAFAGSPDVLVDWDKIEQIHVLTSEEPQCPICLYPPVAGQMTKCGHVYCYPCILHYLALSDKSWRKCPICYDAVYTKDLKSAVSKPYHSFASTEMVTFKLMKREKGTMQVFEADEQKNEEMIPFYNCFGQNKTLSKLLLAQNHEIMNIIEREQKELECQIEGASNCPEDIFVQQALDLLMIRKCELKESGLKEVVTNKCEEEEKLVSIEPIMEAPTEQKGPEDFFVDEDNNLTLSDIDIVPTSQSVSNFYYFYQCEDGQPLYMHSLNNRMLQQMFGSLEKSPANIVGKIIQKDCCSMSEDLRKRLKYLQHLPISSNFEIAEIEFDHAIISKDVYNIFRDEIGHRRRMRSKREKAESIREKRIFEFNERQLGKSLEISANIQIKSEKHFPTCGAFDLLDPHLGSPSTSEMSVSPAAAPSAGPSSWSKMLGKKPSASLWPTLPQSSCPPLYAEQKLVQITGTQMKVNSRTKYSSESDTNDELDAIARPPEFRNDLSMAIECALENMNLHQDPKPSTGGAGGAKKKKNKKMLLFATGMNYN